MRRRFAIAALALVAATVPAVQPPPPSGLAPYLHDGRFDPGDRGWARGAFAGATAGQWSDWLALIAWQERCRAAAATAITAALAVRHVTPVDPHFGNGEGVCGAVRRALPPGRPGGDWAAYQAAVARTTPIAQAIVWSAALAQVGADSGGDSEAALLIARPATDQVLRHALSWGPGAPPLDPAARAVAAGMLWQAIADRDHANTAWLKALVAAHGWPTIAQVGAEASQAAWLLVQHADDDPVFQYDMLRLMEPLAERGAIARANYAMLDDRVRLKLTGKQRFGTQFTCRDGHQQPLPLEDADAVAARRAAMGMETLAQNTARMDALYGPCPPDPVKAP